MALRSSPRKRSSTGDSGIALPPASTPSPTATKSVIKGPAKRPARRESIDESELDCPACLPPGSTAAPVPGSGASADRETWVNCTACRQWYHCICVSLPNPQDYSRWYCPTCIASSSTKKALQNVQRPPTRKSKRARLEVDYAAIQEGMPADPIGRWTRLLENAQLVPGEFRRMKGEEWTVEWLLKDERALSEPVLVPADGVKHESSSSPSPSAATAATAPSGSSSTSSSFEPQRTSIPGMLVPPSTMTIPDIAELIGPDTPVEVIDVASQSSSKAWTLSAWAEYCSLPKTERKKVLNVISLEVTGTAMERLVEAPQLVRDVDWVTRDWPASKRGPDAREQSWPKVQRYVLMGVEGGYSDWHVDFAGSSVYYHVVYGQKTFLFAPPTPHNMAAYRNWCSSTRQDFDWLGDHVQGLRRIDIKPGETMLIPSGWLHSVYTPVDTLVVGGNFLTDWNVETQWKLVEIEEQTKVPKKFRFPHLRRLTWFVARGWKERLDLLAPNDDDDDGHEPEMATLLNHLPPRRVLINLQRLLTTLSDDIDLLHDPYETDEKTTKLKKHAKEAIPNEFVGSLDDAEEMLRHVERRCEKALQFVERVEAERRRRMEDEDKKAANTDRYGVGSPDGKAKRAEPRRSRGRSSKGEGSEHQPREADVKTAKEAQQQEQPLGTVEALASL